jgi:hypothetical protein
MTDINTIPVEEVVVEPKPTGVMSQIGSPEFLKLFGPLIMNGKDDWRTPESLAKKLGVDAKDLSAWMEQQPGLARRPGKEEGTVYYAAIKRLESAPQEKRPPGFERKVITEEDRYAVMGIHTVLRSYASILEKYAVQIHSRNKESLAKLVEAREAMDSGFVQLANTLGVDPKNLPN